jgi:carbon monoxide dehydrogenase subunit G
MKYSSSVSLPVSGSTVRPFIEDLSQYPAWMPLVHYVQVDADGAWSVELRAKVGVFARSKRLRMVRTEQSDSSVVFEREELDNRRHSRWVMKVDINEAGSQCTVTMHLLYDGSLWTPGVLDRVLASHVEAGKSGLARIVAG